MTRWHELRDAIADSNLPASDKAVFAFLLGKADYATAELPARFTPTRRAIARKTSLSYSQVGFSTRHLQRHGWLAAKGATGPGKPLEYSFSAGAQCDCTGRVHTQSTVLTGRVRPGATVLTEPGNGASDWHRSVLTDGANAAGQTVNRTERQREEGVERMGEAESLARRRVSAGGCPLCDGEHDRCVFARGSLYCIRPGCANPHHRSPP